MISIDEIWDWITRIWSSIQGAARSAWRATKSAWSATKEAVSSFVESLIAVIKSYIIGPIKTVGSYIGETAHPVLWVPTVMCIFTIVITNVYAHKNRKPNGGVHDDTQILGSALTEYDKTRGYFLAGCMAFDLVIIIYGVKVYIDSVGLPDAPIVVKLLYRDNMVLSYFKFMVDLTRVIIIFTATALRAADLLSSVQTTVTLIYIMRWSRAQFTFTFWSWDLVWLIWDIILFGISFFVPSGCITSGILSSGNTRETYQSDIGLDWLIFGLSFTTYFNLAYGFLRILGGGVHYTVRLFCFRYELTMFQAVSSYRFYTFCMTTFIFAISVILHAIYLVSHCMIYFDNALTCDPSQTLLSSFLPISVSGYPSYVTCTRTPGSSGNEFERAGLQFVRVFEDPYCTIITFVILHSIHCNDGWFSESMLYEFPESAQHSDHEMINMAEGGSHHVLDKGATGDDQLVEDSRALRDLPLDEDPFREEWVWNMPELKRHADYPGRRPPKFNFLF